MLTADKGARLGNVLIDTLLYVILTLLAEGILAVIAAFIPFEAYLIISTVFPIVLYISYYFLFEHLLSKTPGKYLTQTTVVDKNGNKPTARRLLTRSVLRLLPYDGFSYLFGFTGLHDSVSKTLVVNDNSLSNQK